MPSNTVLAIDTSQIVILPPRRPEHRGRKCLVLDLDETLVHSSFSPMFDADTTFQVTFNGREVDVFARKRPFVDEFLERMGELYEVVVFTASTALYADPLLNWLDVRGVIAHRLFREDCLRIEGTYIKDLSMLGRDLRQVIIVDNSPVAYYFHPHNALPISTWRDDRYDDELLQLMGPLEELAREVVADVRMVLDNTR